MRVICPFIEISKQITVALPSTQIFFVVEVAAHERAIVISKDYSTLKKLVQFIDI